jgi:dihydroorotase
MLRISNGRVIDPASGSDAQLDVLLDGEKVAAIGPAAEISQKLAQRGGEVETFDARGLVVAPGFIDLHCHLREPGGEASETIETGTRAAAHGGFTAVCPMPNTRPVNDNASVTRSILERAAASASVRVWPIGACSIGSKGESLAEIAAMKNAGIVAVSDDGKPVANAKLMRQVMDYCNSLDLPVIDHCEDVSLAAGAVMREGVTSVRLGLRGMPAAAESICVGRDVQVAALTSARFHVAHLSAKSSLDLVREAKQRGLRVTCEVTPHHFTLIDEDVFYDSHFKMNPPLASREDRDALLAGLADGAVDAIATDHAPHEPASKAVEFDKAPFGITAFETALALALAELYHTGRIKLMRLVELFTAGPARVLGIERKLAVGHPADLTIFSTDHSWTFRAADSASKSRNTPFDGRQFKGAPMATIVAGRVIFKRESAR